MAEREKNSNLVLGVNRREEDVHHYERIWFAVCRETGIAAVLLGCWIFAGL